ncbi:hypothetical protein QDR37_09075 [Amnibacterium sp. CER49]|uniref:hypothetical protein n=1 Tax=Amnibacterium sp. CER49 TaxID=3039161 RepID=UPI00244BDA37|nr:hypothetical protein [Amnibacterium sp. CER49]MDH2444096.1 hypothetical protein [Amnibacterium sp. CER49]
MAWYDELQFLAAVPMPETYVRALGTTVNGMWASPGALTVEGVAAAHRDGRRVLFSVPLTALTAEVYNDPSSSRLTEEVCRDIDGRPAEVGWYYWEDEPVLSACIFSDEFRDHLRDLCRHGIEVGADVVDLDEINTSIGLMSRERGGSGFCHRCLQRFRTHLSSSGRHPDDVEALDDAGLRARLKNDDDLYGRYRSHLEEEAFAVIADFIGELRTIARDSNPDFAITANVAYLGNRVADNGRLWAANWGSLLDFVMMENAYQPSSGSAPHLLLPRGTFVPWYRLGAAVSGAPTWICPSIIVPKQFAGRSRSRYYLLMFLEAYVNGGRWGYFWWPGVDDETRLHTTVPPETAAYTRFITENRRYFEGTVRSNALAVLYLDSCVLDDPAVHFDFVALAQALAEGGYQFDVVYSGDGGLASDALPADRLDRYAVVMAPHTAAATSRQLAALDAYSGQEGHELVAFAPAASRAGSEGAMDRTLLSDFWLDYRVSDRDRILAAVPPLDGARIVSSLSTVRVVRRDSGREVALHLVNYDYREDDDSIAAARDFTIELDWEGASAAASLRTLDGAIEPRTAVSQGRLTISVDVLEAYALIVLR